jgi:hypothetical protein
MNIFFCIVNNGYKYFALNFHKRWLQLDIEKKLVFICTDEICYEELKKEGAECNLVQNKNLSTSFHGWTTKEYKKIVFNKLFLTKNFIENHHKDYPFITYVDTDMWVNYDFTKDLDVVLCKSNFDIIFQDGEDYLENIDDCSVLSSDGSISKVRNCINYCTGFMVFKSREKDKIFNLLSYDKEDIEKNIGNQIYINKKIAELNMNVCSLPKKIMPNFSTSFYYKNLERYWMLHYTYIVGKEKIYYMNKNSHWII